MAFRLRRILGIHIMYEILQLPHEIEMVTDPTQRNASNRHEHKTAFVGRSGDGDAWQSLIRFGRRVGVDQFVLEAGISFAVARKKYEKILHVHIER
jgi:hypothetical protein